MKKFSINKNGIEIMPGLVSSAQISSIITEINVSDESMPKHGIRNAEKKFLSIFKLIESKNIQTVASSILGEQPKLVRAIYFDKTPDKNWLVTWHQDKTVSLSHKFDSDDWGPWTIKDKTHHVQPPIEVLNNMVTFRVHLDQANEENGCLKVIPNSHNFGLLKHDEINKIIKTNKPYHCIAKAGDTVIMRPHILHSSSKSTMPHHRRVVHMEFSSYDLPINVRWA